MFVVCLILGSGLPVQFALVNSEDALYCGNRFLANPRVVVAAVVSVKKKNTLSNVISRTTKQNI